MVKRERGPLDRIFQALSDPTRRRMLRALARGDLSVGELARPHALSPPAITKHLKVLEAAGLVRRRREGKTHSVQLRTPPLRRASDWLRFYERFWGVPLERLEDLVEGDG